MVLMALITLYIMLAVGVANTSPKEVDLSVHLGNDLSTSCPVNNEDVLAHSEIPTVHVSDTRSVEGEPVVPVVSHLAQDPLTCGDSASCKSGVPHINTRCVEIEVNAVVCLCPLFKQELVSRKLLIGFFMVTFRTQRPILAWKPYLS